ncbi:hypothetical protein ACFFWC_28200 [Plantactinospora siamensis]|uniref:Uncharacterized protein n=1 Tax=Plantactinospora siamensis TaxID=555372 RepID=A0ABV6NRJ7_9ACTN
MDTMTFDYYLMRRQANPDLSMKNVLAVARRVRPIQAVCWGYRHNRWEARSDVARVWLDPDRDDLILQPADRATAERTAATFTEVPLPTEAELTEICRAAPRPR